ncbi:MAG: response regulator [Salinivirgaceae bacterium]|jgi:signal transduction histidine kinase/ligand-binding sensor domain-containing protein/AraC-like DNA-binding protein|nr:response regulator [Salinivirgaceae bacterium]
MYFKLFFLVIVSFLLLFVQAIAIESDFAFKHITLDNGLSNSNVNCIVQDSNGFIWLGTENGLNKYDGYKFTHYYSDINKAKSLASNEIITLMVDKFGVLWVGTFHGLFIYNEKYDNFDQISFNHIDDKSTNIPVYALLEDADSVVWIGTSGRGMFKYHRRKGIIKAYQQDDNDKYSLSSNFIFSLYMDAQNTIWVGTTDNGLDKFDTKNDKFYNFKPIEGVQYQQNVNAILEIFEITPNKFLLGTRGDGLFIFDKQTGEFSQYTIHASSDDLVQPKEIYNIYKDARQNLWISTHGNGLYQISETNYVNRIEHSEDNPNSLINNNVRTLFEDRQGNLWIVSYQGGVNILPNTYKKFQAYKLDDNTEFSSNIITSALIDERGNIWAGADGGGLSYIDRSNNIVSHYYPGNQYGNIVNDKVVMSLLLDANNLWIGTYLKGVSVLNLNTNKVVHYENSEDMNSLSNNFASCFLKTIKGDLWVGTIGGGINKFNPETKTFQRFVNQDSLAETSLVNDYVNTIAEDNNGRLWIGTFWGISVYDPLNGMFIKYLQNENGKNGLSNNTIYCIKITSKNEIWLGTRNGLNKFIPSSNNFVSFNLSEGLPGNVIYSIEEDQKGNLWLSTNNGICSFNPQTNEIHSYYKNDGLPSNEFFRNASFTNDNGEMLFGSLNGLISFFPDSINENYKVPKVVITKFRIFDQEVIPGKKTNNDIILNKPIYLTDTIVLKHKYNSFAFEFASLDFVLPEKNKYKCKMEGFDQEWRLLNFDHRYVTYTNLDAGTYVFKVKASSIDNEWDNKTTNITIIIKPAIYRTWWAYGFYYVLLIGIILFFWSISIKRVKLKNEIKLERFERDKANEINQAKLRFFTNISHEFRTPITLIVGPLEKMLKDKGVLKKYNDSVNLMLKNANRLLRLVNQLMDLRKIESGQMKLKTEKADIILFLKDIFNSFSDLAEQKQIDFRFLTELESLFCWFDTDKIDKIVFNLLSNAFKFTNENGEIAIVVEEERTHKASQLKVSVIDSGRGIAQKDHVRIFDRFYQTDNPSQNYTAGSGVGLSLTKSLVEQHYGEIKFTSVESKGTEFILLLPLDEAVYSDEEKYASDMPGVNKYIHTIPDDVFEKEIEVEISTDKNLTILIVEDNYDLRKYIVNEFAEYYNIIEAANGKEALEMALRESPDLVISDVVMPEMDGLELCGKIKENFITNHIPVILLTARASIEHRIKGINKGADSYIPKPFNPDHLKVRVKKLLELRQVLKQKYTNELNTPGAAAIVEEDVYLREIKVLILENIDDPDLNIEKICKEMGISRAHFYRKIKLITDKSPTEFVRIIRLNEAAKLLIKNDKSISEVCYMVGFNSPSYFSICFKEHFKVSPIDFVKQNQKKK